MKPTSMIDISINIAKWYLFQSILQETLALIVWLSACKNDREIEQWYSRDKISMWLIYMIDYTFSFSSFSLSGSMSVMQFLTLYTFLCLESTIAVNNRWEFDDNEDGINFIFLSNLPCDWRTPCMHVDIVHSGETVIHQQSCENNEVYLSMSKEKMCLLMLCILHWYVKNFIPN